MDRDDLNPPQETTPNAIDAQRRFGNRREIAAWAMYDWANSAYSTLLITTLNGYLLNVVFPNNGPLVDAWGIALSMFVAAILSPILGALADARANKRLWFRATALGGATCGALLGVVPPQYPWAIAALFVLTSFFFELSFGFYNAFLPEIADERSMNRVSAAGFACGYIGGGIALAIALLLFLHGDAIGIQDQTLRVRVGLVLMGVWWGVFSLPAILILRDKSRPRAQSTAFAPAARLAVREVATTLSHLRHFQALAWFLIGFLFYNDAVQTVLTQASTFARQELELTDESLIPIILMIQFVSMPGALFIGWLADKIGQKPALYLCLAVWVGLLAFSWWVTSITEFWIMGACVALVMGGIQSVSRSIMGVMTPANRTAEFFGFYNLSSKATSFIGPFTFGLVIWLTDSARWAILSLLAQLIVGWLLVSRVDVTRGHRDAIAASANSAA
jgi:MFS transporter, UMF1 family